MKYFEAKLPHFHPEIVQPATEDLFLLTFKNINYFNTQFLHSNTWFIIRLSLTISQILQVKVVSSLTISSDLCKTANPQHSDCLEGVATAVPDSNNMQQVSVTFNLHINALPKVHLFN